MEKLEDFFNSSSSSDEDRSSDQHTSSSSILNSTNILHRLHSNSVSVSPNSSPSSINKPRQKTPNLHSSTPIPARKNSLLETSTSILDAPFIPHSNRQEDDVENPMPRVQTALPPPLSAGTSENIADPNEDMKDMKRMMGTLVKQNKELIDRVAKLEEQSIKKKKIDITVPNDVRYKVRQAYEDRKKQGLTLWKFDNNPGPFNESNMEVTNFVRNFVSGLYPNLENRDAVINSAIKTYYASNISAIRRKNRYPDKSKDLAKKQRRIHKAERRKKALNKYVTKFDDDTKEELAKAIIPDMMSSEEEVEDENGKRYFMVRKPEFRSKRFERVIKVIDTAYHENSSKRSKDQFIERQIGGSSKRPPPKSLDFGYKSFIKEGY